MGNSGNKTLVLTGATGFLGSHLMSAFLARGYDLFILGRPQNGTGLTDRIMRHLAWFGSGHADFSPHVVEADLLKPRLGLASHNYRAICRTRPVIVHCASQTSFSDRDRQASIDANIGALRGITDLARDSDSSALHHISTAYVTQTAQAISYETPVTRSDFANIYEETKTAAEKVIMSECSRQGIPYTIIRPSIVYGDSTTGRANYFNALYYHVRALKIIRDIYRKDIDEYEGRRSRGFGIYYYPDGSLRLPLRIFLPCKGNLNLIPINFFTEIMLSIIENPRCGSIYHVTNDIPKSIEEIAGYCEKFLKIQGIRVVYGDFTDEGDLNPPEEIFNRLARPYLPYLSDTRIFDRTNTRMASGISAPEMTYDIFLRCMEYAVRTSWGSNGASKNSITGI